VLADWAAAHSTSLGPVRSVNGPLDATLFAAFAAASGGVIPIPADPFDLDTSLNDPADTTVKDRGLSVEVTHQTAVADFTLIAASRSFDTEANKDVDFSALDFFRTEFDFKEDFFSTEVRATGTVMDVGPFVAIDWLAGAYYADEDIDSTANFPTQGQVPLFLSITANSFGIPLAPTDFANGEDTGIFQDRGVDARTFALFGHATFDFTQRFGITAGLRYNQEEKKNYLVDNTIAGPGNLLLGIFAPAPDFRSLEFDEDEITGDTSLNFRWTERLMTYVKYSRGYKAGGINLDAGGGGTFLMPVDPEFDSETSDSWELGLRSTWLDGRATVNATAFSTDFEDFQVQSFDGVSFLLSNVAGVSSKGVELETWFEFGALSMSAGATWADATFDDHVTTGFADVGGERLPLSSEWTGSLSATYSRPLGSGALEGFLHGEMYARSDSNLDSSTLDPVADQAGYEIYNARIGIGARDGRWQVALWCRNCTDEDYGIFTFAAPFQPGSWNSVVGMPRTWGVSLTGSL
jgi:outer membrane receptor protein involved in Fe transport